VCVRDSKLISSDSTGHQKVSHSARFKRVKMILPNDIRGLGCSAFPEQYQQLATLSHIKHRCADV